jgi:hypothetical protein
MKRLAFLGLALVLAVGCDDGTTPTDSGTGTDSGMPGTDSGMTGVDSGMGTDSGMTGTDSGPGDDAGPTDGGVVTGDCTAAPITIMATCPTFTPCGGSPSGAYCYTDVCITEAEVLGSAASVCPTLMITSSSGSVTGRVEFLAGMMVSRMATTHVEGTVAVPPSCVIGGCGTVETLMNNALMPNGSATCTPAGGGACTCDIVLDANIDNTSTYTTSGNTLTVGAAGSARTYDYCVESGGQMRFRETTAMAQEIGVQTLTPAL